MKVTAKKKKKKRNESNFSDKKWDKSKIIIGLEMIVLILNLHYFLKKDLFLPRIASKIT